MRPLALRRLLLCLLLLVAAAPPPVLHAARGQDEEAQEAPAEPDVPSFVGQGYASPRECMRALLEGARAVHVDQDTAQVPRLLRAFDLGDWVEDGTWREEGLERTRLLYEVLNRTVMVDIHDLPGREERRDFHTWWHYLPGWKDILTLDFRRTSAGAWLIEREALEEAPRWFELVRDEPVIEAILEDLPVLEQLRHRLRESLPRSLQAEGFILENWQWLGILVLVLVGVILDRVVRFLIALLVRRLATSESLRLRKGSLANFERPFGLFFIAFVFGGLLPLLGLEPGVRQILDIAASFVMTVTGIWAAIRMVDVLCDFLRARAQATENKFDDMLVPLLRKTLKIVVSVIGLVYIASKLTEEVYTILAGLSIGSLAIGFAAKDSIENLFGTFTVLMDKPFQLGDWIVFGDIEGTVEKVGFRSTRVRTFYNSITTVPNSRFISADVDNMGQRRFRRIKTTLSLTYDTPPEKIDAFCEAVRELIRRHPYTRKDYYFVHLNAFAASSLDVLLYAFVETPDWGTELREKHRLFADILRVAERLNVSFAFPTQSLHMVRPEDLEHPDTPESWQAAEKAGEALGREVAEEGLKPFGGQRPKPAVIRQPTKD